MFASKYFSKKYFASSYWSNYGNAVVVAINTMSYNGNPVSDVKYFDGSSLVDVVVIVNGSTVWSK